MSKVPKTQGVEWLLHSLAAFNGSGYADMDSPKAFLESYKAYKTIKKKPEAVALANAYEVDALAMLSELLKHTHGAGRQPSSKMQAKVNYIRKHEQGTLL